jgi:Cu+-exporting ATPase
VEEAIDPICGMTVALAAAKETAVRDGITYYFCSAHCRKRFEAETAPV